MSRILVEMFDVLSGEFILTLQSSPPFVVESAFALALAVLLAAPLIASVYFLLVRIRQVFDVLTAAGGVKAIPNTVRDEFMLTDEPLKAFTKIAVPSSRRHVGPLGHSLGRLYPTPVTIDSTSSSSLHLESIRRQIDRHTPVLRNNNCVPRSPNQRGEQIEEEIGGHEQRGRERLPLDYPLSLANTNCSLIDISNLDYRAYRHKIIEATLKKRYDDLQPPGDVVLNSLHLNSADSVIGVRLNDRYDHSLFNFVEEYHNESKVTNQGHIKCLHPLDHFLTKSTKRPRTTEKETETLDENVDCEDTGNDLSSRINDDLAKLSPDVDSNGNPPSRSSPRGASIEDNIKATPDDPNSNSGMPKGGLIQTQSRKPADKLNPERCAENDCPRSGDFSARESSWTTGNRPTSAGSASTSLPKGLALSRAATLPERSGRRVTRSPGPRASTGGSKKKLGDYSNWEFPSSGEHRRAEKRGPPGFISASSSEIASVRSERSSKRQDVNGVPCCSRESSISPASRASRPPWLSANHGTSFNRKYGETARNPAWNPASMVRPMSARDDRLRRLVTPDRGRSKEPSSAFVNRSDPAAPFKRRAMSFVSSPSKGERVAISTGRREANLSTSPRNKTKNVERVAAKNGTRTATTPDPLKEGAGKTAISKSSKEMKSTCGSSARERSVSEDTTVNRTVSQAAVRADGRWNTVRLNRGNGGKRLRSTGNPAFAKGASLSPKIELSAEALSRADGSTIPCDEKLTVHASGIDSRVQKRAEVAENDETRAILNARDQLVEMNEAVEAREDGKSNNINGSLARLKVPQKITRNPRARPASASNLAGSPHEHKTVPSPHSARRNANAETKSGLSAAKLNARSNDTVDRMRSDKESSSVLREQSAFEKTKTRERDVGPGNGAETEGLKLPRRDSKIGLAMDSALRRYIKMLKHGLLNRGDKDGVALASLSLTDAISFLSEQKIPLSPEEIQELQSILSKVERNPELLCEESFSNMENVV
ncbi:hypothetical protein X777_16493 [Ooceraea biroi]|uniref:Uncharacterized protein n=1 Tax=Ooceraea biroi TaxID=2015173 RepID=A0A026VUQ2_OOCBI|nr:hypothetical protein X777_16493 [Ooceraea biroi]